MDFKNYLEKHLETKNDNWFVFWNDEICDTSDVVSNPFLPIEKFDNLYIAIKDMTLI